MNSSDTIPFTCSPSYSNPFEIFKYFLNFSYLASGGILHILILKSILISEKKDYSQSSFFHLYAVDSFASLWNIIWEAFFMRVFMFIPPLCPLLAPYFMSSRSISKIYFFSTNYVRFMKYVAQIFMVLNRMTCVLMPTFYSQIWKKCTKPAILMILLSPILGTWNIAISRVFAISAFGGIGFTYQKYIEWATLSLFQLIFVTTALIFTIICTSITLYQLIIISHRIKSAEKSLCIASAYISVTFLLMAFVQIYYVICSTSCSFLWLFYIGQFYVFDIFIIGSAVIMLLTSEQLRSSICSGKMKNSSSENRVFHATTNAFAN